MTILLLPVPAYTHAILWLSSFFLLLILNFYMSSKNNRIKTLPFHFPVTPVPILGKEQEKKSNYLQHKRRRAHVRTSNSTNTPILKTHKKKKYQHAPRLNKLLGFCSLSERLPRLPKKYMQMGELQLKTLSIIFLGFLLWVYLTFAEVIACNK